MLFRFGFPSLNEYAEWKMEALWFYLKSLLSLQMDTFLSGSHAVWVLKIYSCSFQLDHSGCAGKNWIAAAAKLKGRLSMNCLSRSQLGRPWGASDSCWEITLMFSDDNKQWIWENPQMGISVRSVGVRSKWNIESNPNSKS